MISPSDVVDLYTERRKLYDKRHRAMTEVAKVYDDEADVALPELDRNEKPSVSNLIRQGIDQEAMRVASPTPMLHVPSLRTGEAAEKRARERRSAWLGSWEANNLPAVMRLRARHLLGMGMSPAVLWPDEELQGARWEAIDPRMCFPPPYRRPGQTVPDDFVYAVERTLAWCKRMYPDVAQKLSDSYTKPDTKVRLVCHIDPERITLVAMCDPQAQPGVMHPAVRAEPVGVLPNRAGRVLATVPSAISMSEEHSQFEAMLGMYQHRAFLMALHSQAIKQGIFPDGWLEGDNSGRTPTVEEVPDPYTGQLGVVRDGKIVFNRPPPDFATPNLLHEIEAAERMTGSIPSDFGGQSSTNVRTGRRAQQLISSTIDFHIEEAQTLLAGALTEECKIAAEIEKKWFGEADKSYWVNWKGARGHVAYKPSQLWGESTECKVTYAMAGADTDALIIGAGQRVGMGTMSKRSFAELDPMVEDPEFEMDRVTGERLRDAFLASIEQQAGTGQGPFADPVLLARLVEMVETDKADVMKAVADLNAEVQAEQEAAMAEQAQIQPGISPEGSALAPTIPPAEETLPGVQNLAGVLAAGRMPQLRTPVEA